MNTEEHELKHDGIVDELDHVSNRIVKGEDTDEDLLKRIEKLEKEMTAYMEVKRINGNTHKGC